MIKFSVVDGDMHQSSHSKSVSTIRWKSDSGSGSCTSANHLFAATPPGFLGSFEYRNVRFSRAAFCNAVSILCVRKYSRVEFSEFSYFFSAPPKYLGSTSLLIHDSSFLSIPRRTCSVNDAN